MTDDDQFIGADALRPSAFANPTLVGILSLVHFISALLAIVEF